jgi:hypothetical protein
VKYEVFIAFDTAKKKRAVAIVDVGRDGEIRFLGAIDSSPATVERVIGKLTRRYEKLHAATKPVRRGMACTARFGPWITTVLSSRRR